MLPTKYHSSHLFFQKMMLPWWKIGTRRKGGVGQSIKFTGVRLPPDLFEDMARYPGWRHRERDGTVWTVSTELDIKGQGHSNRLELTRIAEIFTWEMRQQVPDHSPGSCHDFWWSLSGDIPPLCLQITAQNEACSISPLPPSLPHTFFKLI